MRTLMVAVILVGGTATAAPKAKPTLEHGEPTVSGSVDASAIIKLVKRSSAKLLGCYKKALVTQPALYGTATVTFTIGTSGTVTTADTTGITASAGACIAMAITKIRFAKPKNGQPVDVTYPLTFDPGDTGNAFASITGSSDITSLGGIGSGTIGAGGSGSGYGVGGGRGGMRGHATDVQTATVGQPAVQGDLDKAIIRRYIQRNIQKLAYCYEKQLLDTPKLEGMVTASFTIGTDGLVSSSTAKGMGNTNVETCVADVIKAIEFPKPKGNGAVTVTYPFTFKLPAPPAKK